MSNEFTIKMKSSNEVIETIFYLPVHIKEQDEKIRNLLAKIELIENTIKDTTAVENIKVSIEEAKKDIVGLELRIESLVNNDHTVKKLESQTLNEMREELKDLSRKYDNITAAACLE